MPTANYGAACAQVDGSLSLASEQAEAAESTAPCKDPQRIDACPDHQPGHRDRQGCPLPPGIPGAGHHGAAGDDKPDRQRRETPAHDPLPRRITNAIPQLVARKIHAQGGPNVAPALTIAPRTPPTFQPMKLISRIMFGPGTACARPKKLANSWSVTQPLAATTKM